MQSNSQQQAQREKMQQQISERMSRIGRTVAIMSNKGGVGKSTVAVNIATEMARRGLRVGLLDTDLHGPSDSWMLGLQGRRMQGSDETLIPLEGPFGLRVVSIAALMDQDDAPLIWRGPMKTNIIRQFLGQVEWGELDWLCIDSPPGTGDEPLSVLQLLSELTGVLIVTTPQQVATLDAQKAIAFARKLDAEVLGIVENMSVLTCPQCGTVIEPFGTGGAERVAARYAIPLLGKLPLDPAVGLDADKGQTIAQATTRRTISGHIDDIVERLLHTCAAESTAVADDA